MDGWTFGRRSPRVLVVEPNPGSNEIIVEVLSAAGCRIVGPCLKLEQASRLVEDKVQIDGAVLEMAISGSFSFNLAKCLMERGKPVIFFSRCGAGALPIELRSATVLSKPHGIEQLAAMAIATFFEP